jgi:iron(III) transport system ATP-binding protein
MKIGFEHVSKSFGSVPALQDVSLEIANGELFFLLGPSGCGKTTLLRCLAGFEQPDSGHILLDGKDISDHPPHRRNTAMVFQGYALWPHMTVAENVAFGLEMKGIPRSERNPRVRDVLRLVQIEELAERKPNELSGGQQQRVALARTLVVEPGCLLLDEPLANLDAKLRRDMRSEIRRICKQSGQTAIYVTHDRQEALSMADRLAVFRDGRILQVGNPQDVYRRPTSAFVAGFIGEANFIEGRIKDAIGNTLCVDTLFGLMVSANAAPGLSVGDDVLLSLRHEAIRIGEADQNAFTATLRETTYLGEISEHIVEIHDNLTLKVFELNPREPGAPGTRITLNVSAEDVVVLPKPSGCDAAH